MKAPTPPEIIDRVREWTGGEAEAMARFRSQKITALDGLTAETLIKSGTFTTISIIWHSAVLLEIPALPTGLIRIRNRPSLYSGCGSARSCCLGVH